MVKTVLLEDNNRISDIQDLVSEICKNPIWRAVNDYRLGPSEAVPGFSSEWIGSDVGPFRVTPL